jgi:hypothetical protein
LKIKTGTNEEELRKVTRTLLRAILDRERRIERWEEQLSKATARGNDPNEIRVEMERLGIEKLDFERKLEKIDKKIIDVERRNIQRAA